MVRCSLCTAQAGAAGHPLTAMVPPLVSAVQAPEVLEGASATAASDVYSFGMVSGRALRSSWAADGVRSWLRCAPAAAG